MRRTAVSDEEPEHTDAAHSAEVERITAAAYRDGYAAGTRDRTKLMRRDAWIMVAVAFLIGILSGHGAG